MDVIDKARASGMTVILDGRIDRDDYQSAERLRFVVGVAAIC